MLNTGDTAPDFELEADDGQLIRLSDLKGQSIVLYFYPKDDTPGCTIQACDFRDNLSQFETQGWKIFGISPDDTTSHKKFKGKYDINFQLLSDPEHKVATLYGVWGKKKMYGREYEGIIRSTFLIDASGILTQVQEKVRPKGHVTSLLSSLANS